MTRHETIWVWGNYGIEDMIEYLASQGYSIFDNRTDIGRVELRKKRWLFATDKVLVVAKPGSMKKGEK
jgi:hypothetical protein